ncbi:M48 family metallopeptidase [Nonomuraea guangzhouensis]|uniref:M48 family metallopeptidase n=1 Tax=Nonomuraea guangzhouensis TaxID=1291555 RepID=A0ABW4FZR9_9ACTN|nr:M48 family metallopeptidase [Nonomuraea guangzhouensis]
MKRLAALVLALIVHTLTLAFVVLGGWTIVVNAQFAAAWALGGLLIALGWMLRPRLGRLPADAEVLDPASARQLYGMADRVADRIGVRPPQKVAVRDLVLGAGYARNGLLRTPVLVIGLPSWLALSPRQRVALLARAYAELPTGDELIVNGALSTLGEWREALLGAAPLRVREEAQTKIASSLGMLDTVGTGYEVAGFLGRIFGRVLGGPVLLTEYSLNRLARSGDARRREQRQARALRVITAEELAEIDGLLAGGSYVAPMQAAALRGESVASIRQAALSPASPSAEGVLIATPGSELLGSAESDRIDDELLRHYTRAIRGFGLII